MKKILTLVLLFGMAASPAFAVDKEVIKLQQDVALLQGMVRELQRSYDEKMAVVVTLVTQTADRLNQLSQSNGQISGQVGTSVASLEKTVQTAMANSSQKVDNLNTGLQGVEATLDDLKARLDQISEQVAKLTSASQSIPAGTPPANTGAPVSGDPNTGAGASLPSPDVLYNTAQRDYTGSNYPLALQEFRDYLQYFPTSALASNAQFYIGDIYYQQGQFDKAIIEYDKSIEQYPNGNKAASAQLKKGFALINIDRRAEAVKELNNLLKRFPTSPEASLAKDKLANLPPAKATTARKRLAR